MKRRSCSCLIALLLAAGLTACSISLPTSSSTPSSDRATDDPVGDPGTDPTGSESASASASAPETPGPSLGPVVASRSSASDGKTIDLDLYRIVREGHLVHVSFTVRSTEDAVVGDLFSDRESNDYEADGITLIDPAAKKLYLVASHGQGSCLCTATGGLTLSHDRPSVVSASFAAPPGGVTTMGVQIPHFGVFSSVPVV